MVLKNRHGYDVASSAGLFDMKIQGLRRHQFETDAHVIERKKV